MAKAAVYVTYKKGVLDPQGETVRGALASLGFEGVQAARVGKYIELDLADGPREDLRAEVERMCRELLSNPVIEDFRIEFPEEEERPAPPAGAN
ncbi:MAG: phosphoribosylformylglycinamidine synthase subunit PurS [bacterium]